MGKRRHHAPGWSATSLLFGDALDCLSGTSFSVSGGFSYKLTDLSLGRPIAQGTETFSFDPQFDLAGPSDFFVLFSAPNGPLLACAGNTATGCDGPASAVPAPGSVPVLATGMVLLGLCGVCRSMPRLIPVLLAIGSMWAGHAQARITRIVADSRTPAYNGTVQGNAGAYETITGRTFGTLDPTTPQNSIIQDIQLSPKSAPGLVGYISTFTIIKPVDMSQARITSVAHPSCGGATMRTLPEAGPPPGCSMPAGRPRPAPTSSRPLARPSSRTSGLRRG